jgi:ribonuclease D
LDYASLDVIYLHEIYEKFQKILQEKNRQKFYDEEIKLFIDKALFNSKNNLIKNFSLRKMSAKQIAILKNLIIWREDQAKYFNVPRQHFLRDEELEELARNCKIPPNIGEKIIEKSLKNLEEILRDEYQNPEIEINDEGDNLFLTNDQKIIFLEAKKIITKIANQENIAEQFLFNNTCLKKIILGQDNLEFILLKIAGKWRYQLLHQPLTELFKNK